MFWGFSESLDLYQEYNKSIKSDNDHQPTTELNILLFGGGDPRHIIKTISKSYLHKVKLNFYILEGCLEILARQFLLLNVAFEHPDSMTLKGKTHLFMDIYGNSLLRPTSQHYLNSKINNLIKIITDLDWSQSMYPIWNFQYFKYKERDQFESIFKFWLTSNANIDDDDDDETNTNTDYKQFNISTYWNQRIRQMIGDRYDARMGTFDWDLQMKLKDCGVKQICSQEYRWWRDTGVAFTFPQYEQSLPNRTFATGIIACGRQFKHRGYMGDITVGPFIPFGLHCSDTDMLRSTYGINQYRATDITERNLFEIMYEIEHQKQYIHDPVNSHAYGGIQLELDTHLPFDSMVNSKKKTITGNVNASNNKYKKFDTLIDSVMDNCNYKIYFLSTDDDLLMNRTLNLKPEFNRFFDIIFIARNYMPLWKSDGSFIRICNDNCLFLFESQQYSLMTKNAIDDSLQNIKFIAKTMNLTPITKFNLNTPLPIVKYTNLK